ncbi:MAG: glycosyltransferase [bacterium]|nr:glycosyltransferase [bacterium]MDD5757166.1 glycosyltransferase [bacterium]
MTKVSVIIPTYNRAELVCEAIESVLRQAYRDYEIIVIDDGSNDDTVGKLREYGNKIKYIHQKNKGVSAARNKGILEAAGEYIAFLDSDDIWVPYKLERQVKYFEDNPAIGLVYSYGNYLSANTKKEQVKPRVITRSLQELVEEDAIFPTSTVMAKKKCLEEAGLFDETLTGIEDFDLWFRVAEKFPIGFMPEILAHHRWHGTHLAEQSDKMSNGYIKIYNRIIAKYKDQYNVKYMKKRLAQQYYSLGIHNFKEKNIGVSFAEVNKAISVYPLVGIRFAQKDDRFLRRATLSVKPYLVWLYLLMIRTLGKK